jgi:hypothetical protein
VWAHSIFSWRSTAMGVLGMEVYFLGCLCDELTAC